LRQFYINPPAASLPSPGETVALDREESHHLATVLRGGREQKLCLTDGCGHRWTGVVTAMENKQALVRIDTFVEDALELQRPRLILACAMVKGKRFEWALEKAVELGAHAIVPLQCDHGVVTPRDGKQTRWLAVMKSALKQCGRSWFPDLAKPVDVAKALADHSTGRCVFGAAPWESPREPVRPWLTLLANTPEVLPRSLVIFVGPEGGWSPAELDLLSAQATAVSLGPHVLRAETAVAAGLTALQAVRQKWNPET